MVWHTETALPAGTDLVVIPGGFSYGDYLRCGAIAARSPIMDAVRAHAGKGGLTLAVCNGFQIACEAGLLPGVLMRNARLRFICRDVYSQGRALRYPVQPRLQCRSGDPRADRAWRGQLHRRRRDRRPAGRRGPGDFPLRRAGRRTRSEVQVNGSTNAIAGIVNERGNVLGMMPHPENHVEAAMGRNRRPRPVRRAGRGSRARQHDTVSG